jgi:hypothetical protein
MDPYRRSDQQLGAICCCLIIESRSDLQPSSLSACKALLEMLEHGLRGRHQTSNHTSAMVFVNRCEGEQEPRGPAEAGAGHAGRVLRQQGPVQLRGGCALGLDQGAAGKPVATGLLQAWISLSDFGFGFDNHGLECEPGFMSCLGDFWNQFEVVGVLSGGYYKKLGSA